MHFDVSYLTPCHPFFCMYVCMYVCMHVCMHACMHACMYVCMHACMYVCMYVCMYACMHACMHVCMHVCMCVCVYVYANARGTQRVPRPQSAKVRGCIFRRRAVLRWQQPDLVWLRMAVQGCAEAEAEGSEVETIRALAAEVGLPAQLR